MHRETLVKRLKLLRPQLEAEGVRHLVLFGSRARGDNGPDSDIDLLVEVDPGARFSLLDLIGIEHLISDATGVRANAFMRRSLDTNFRASIEPDLVGIY